MGHHKSLAVAKLSKLRIILGNNIVHFCWYKYRVQSPLEFSLLWLLEVETLSPSLAARAVNRGDESCIRFCLFSFIRCLSVHLTDADYWTDLPASLKSEHNVESQTIRFITTSSENSYSRSSRNEQLCSDISDAGRSVQKSVSVICRLT